MYNYKGVLYTIDQINEAAKQSNMSVDNYVKKLKEQDPEPKTTKQMESADLLDPNFQQDAAAGADVVSQPMTASQAGVTELPSEDTSSELQDLDPEKPLSASEKRIATRKKRQQKKQDELKAEAVLATNVINDRIKNIPNEDIVAIQANDYFGPIKSRNDRTTVSKTVPGMMGPTVSFEPTFNSDESYTNYLKETLGGKYNQYLDYKETNKIVPLNTQNQSQLEGIYDEAEKQAKDKVYNNSLFNVPENVQEYMVASPNFASGAESLEAQEFLVKDQEETLRKNIESYKKVKKEWELQALPLNKEIKDLKTQVDRFKFYTAGASQEQVDQYNELIQTYNAKIQQWEEKGFNELPAFVNSQAKLVNSQQEGYSKMLEDSRKALINVDLFEKNLKQDYSASARVGRVFDEFFVQSGRNFIDLTAEIGLKAAKAAGMGGFTPLSFLTSPENSAKVDSVIQTIQKNNKNYNLKIASKRENIPTSPSIDDIGKDGLSVWDWTSIALQDNSATISTTFVPGLAQLKGATTLTKAIKTGKGVKDALQKQKALWLAGKRTVQGTFFVAETGGKYGELQTDEASREQEIKFLYSKLDNTEDINEKTEIYNKITELEEVEDYSLLQKAFTSFGAGTTATFLETISTLKMLEPAKGLAKQIGIKAAKKELYKQPIRFSANLIGKTLAGLKSLPKNLTGEILEETATELSHNGLDILVLGENKSMFEGINKDFLASTAMSSFGIMAPRSAGNIFNIVKSEFRTKSEIFNNQKLARELIDLNESTTLENSKELRVRKKEILKELALSDAISLHKLRYMTSDQIEEVADINRQMRQVNGKFSQLGRLGDLGEAENKRVKKQLEEEYIALSVARQEILDTKQRSNIKKAANMIKILGAAARNSNAAFYFGVNDFYNEVAMTQMGDGDFISIKGEIQEDNSIKYEGLDEKLAKYKGKMVRVTDDKTGEQTEVDAFEFLKESIENNKFNATQLFGDIIVNQTVIDREILIRPTETGAQYAAVAPLEELFHLSVAQKGIKFDVTAKNAVLEAENILKEKRDLGVISEKDYNGLKERFDLYRSSDGEFDAEEFIAQINNAIALGAMNRSDFDSAPSFKKFLNNSIRSAFGDMSWMLKVENSDDVFNLVKNFQADVSKGVTFQAPETDELKESRSIPEYTITKEDWSKSRFPFEKLKDSEFKVKIAGQGKDRKYMFFWKEEGKGDWEAGEMKRQLRSALTAIAKRKLPIEDEVKFSKSEEASQEVQRIYEEQGVAGAFDILEKFKPITNKLVERRRDAPNFDKQLLTDEIETGKRGIFDLIKEYKPESGVPLAAYINKFLPARAIEASKRVLGEEFTDDVTEAKGVAAEEVAISVKEEPTRKISPKKLKKYTGVVASNLGVSSSEVSNVIDKAIEADLKTKPIKTFGESRNIGDNLAKTLGKAFGLNPEVFTKKTRNIQKKELDGLRNLRQFLDNNAAKDFSLLPDAYAGPSTIEGKSTFIPNNILNALYRKNNKGKWEKDPTKTVQDYKNLLGKIDGSVYRAAEAQTIKGLAAMSFRNLIVEKAAETAEPKARVDIKAGAKFSKAAQSLGRAARRKPGGLSKENNLKPIKRGTVKYIGSNGQEKSETRWQLTDKEKIELPLFINSIARLFDKSFFTTGNFAFGQRSLVGKAGDLKKALEGAEYNDNAPVMPKRFEYKKLSPSQIKAKVKDKNFIDNQEKLLPYLNFIFTQIQTDLKQNPQHLKYWEAVINDAQNSQSHFMRFLAPFKFYNLIEGKIVEEHSMPQNNVANFLLESALNGTVNKDFPFIEDNYFQGALLETDDKKTRGKGFNYVSQMPEVFFEVENPTTWLRYLNENVSNTKGGINPNQYALLNGQTLADFFNAGINKSLQNLDMISFQQEEILKKLKDNKYNPQRYVQEYGRLVRDKAKASKVNNKNTPSSVKFSRSVTNQEALDNLGNIDKALSIARNPNAPIKKIRVFDFDDTLATTKSNVLYTMPNGETGSLTATEFAKKAGEMEAQGAEWDFSEFSKVMKGAKGPLLDVAKFISDAKGERDIFVLTARPQDAAGPIKEFLDSMGLNIPLENITGLGDGTAQAKARWMVDKAAEGYNDFYFADDASKNVKAVKDALSVLDVKSKVQQAYVKFSKASKLNKDFNDILQGATGIASEKVYGRAKAQVAGASRGKVFRGISYSAQDFVGLLYETLGKGKEGDAQMAWYKQNLLDPYARAMNDLSSARLAMMNDYRALKKQLGIVPKNLRKKVPGEPWTREQAVRVYVWSKQGTEVPGISKNDLKELNSFVSNNSELQVFADQLIAIQKGDIYPEPGESWVAGSISTDMLRGLNTIKRAKYLEQWQTNVDAIFSKENKNKLEAAYGIKYVKALENSLERMKTGRNRSFSDDSLTGRFTDWLQGSVGAIMFFNTRSAVLQTLSAVNFINFTDNNPYAAAKAFGNQKQYWKDFTTLINSDFLKERRSGLRMNVNEADIADMAKQEGPRGVINKLLQLGFAPTQIADSFAIASGGATFYRNRIKTYTKQGMDQAQAEEKAFQDFRENAEESQQSSRPDKISAQQAGPLGRLILAFANTPAQYARLTDKAIRDLKNGRGDAKTNISKIIYYTTVQNLIFNAIQQALFAMAFDEEEVEDEKAKDKYVNIANGMADSLLRGTGIAGSVISVGKNAIIRIINESKKKRPKYEKVGYELTKISPPVSAKLSRINQAARAYEWNKEEMMTKGFSLDNPAFLAGGNVISALTNIPLDRVVKKVNNVTKATESDLELWERVALFAGWQDWELGIKDEKKPKKRKRKTIGRKIIKKVLIK